MAAVYSIVIVTKNANNEIGKTIDSVLGQNFGEWECIVKDGASDDGTVETVRKYAGTDERIKLISEPDLGIYDAMNRALEECAGEWIIFLNSGDSFRDETVLERIADKGFLSGASVLYGDAEVVYKDRKGIWAADMDKLPYRMPFCHQSCLIKREVIKEFGFKTEFKIAADLDLVIRLKNSGKVFEDMHMIISKFDLSGVSSSRYLDTLKDRYKVMDSSGIHIGPSVKIREYILAYMKTAAEMIFSDKMLTGLKYAYMKKYSAD